jgi:hypothetical protein
MTAVAHPEPMTLRDPLSIDDARDSLRAVADLRRHAEAELRAQVERSATAEADYRRALATAFVTVEGGTAAEREARPRAAVADLSYQRDLQAGLVKACLERIQGLDGERASIHRLVEYSMQLVRATEQQPAPSWSAAG